jgi:hypothetical protein
MPISSALTVSRIIEILYRRRRPLCNWRISSKALAHIQQTALAVIEVLEQKKTLLWYLLVLALLINCV